MSSENTVQQNTESSRKAVLYTLVTLSIPTILEEILSTLLQFVDTAMVGHLGEKATAAVSTTTTINWLIGSLPGAVGVAALALIARAVGAKDHEKVHRLAGQVLLLSTVIGAVMEMIALFLSPYIPVWMGAAADIRAEASLYFTIISIPLIPRTWTRILASAIRATRDTRTPMLITFTENVLNVILNATLIYGLGWGVKGAAVASAVSFAVGGFLMLFVFCRNSSLHFELRCLLPDTDILRQCVTISLPALFNNLISCLGYVVFAGMVSGMGTVIFAAHSIAIQAEEIVYLPGYGFRTATGTLVGNALGERNEKKLRYTEQLSILITIGIMFIGGLLLYLFAYPLMSIFTSSEQVTALGARALRMVAFSEPFFGLMIVIEGIFYGMGETRQPFVIESCSMWFVRILFTFLCVKVWHLGLFAVWGCMIADNVFKAVMLLVCFVRKHPKTL